MSKRRWRHYRTKSGACPTLDFIRAQPLPVIAEIVAGMKRIEREGLSIARKLRGDIWEVRNWDYNGKQVFYGQRTAGSHAAD